MPEPAVAAETLATSSLSESSLGGGGGTLNLSDEDILGIGPEDTTPAAPAAPPTVKEEAAPAETPSEPKTETSALAPEPIDDLKWMRPLLNDKTFGPKLQSMHDRLLAFQEMYPTVADARAIKELLPGGAEELKNLVASKRETDEMDLQFFGGDAEQQREYLTNLYRESPDSFQSAIQVGLDLIKGQSPQEWAYLTQHLVGDSMQSEKVWDWLEYIHESAVKAGATDVAQLLNQFAGQFQKYGLGPRQAEDPNLARVRTAQGEFDQERQQWRAERATEFNADAEKGVTAALDTEIGAQLSKLLPKTSDNLRGRMTRDVHAEIQKAVGADAGLKLRLANLVRSGGINRQTQGQVINLLVSKARLILPGAVKRIVGEYTASVTQHAQEVNEKQTTAASRVDVSGGSRPRTGPRQLTREDARSMSFEDILNSDRPAGR